jgi:GTP cyclohydrolase I
MDRARIEKAVRELIEAIGEDPRREGLQRTPQRVAEMCREIFAGISADPREQLRVFSTPNQDEMILVRDIPFYSMCEHHLLPFFGTAHLAYIPDNDRVTGFSHLVRVVDVMSRRPQLQERLTTEIADIIMEVLEPKGVLVVVEAEHLCMTMRGVKKLGSVTTTSAMRGVMRREATRAEAFALIKGHK